MATKVVCTELSLSYFQVNALAFIPQAGKSEIRTEWALFTHGYTANKADCLSWATRLSESGVPALIFDQPGHYLGSFHECDSFEDFKTHAHELFAAGFSRLQDLMEAQLGLGNFPTCANIILGGHSLGAFTCIRALELPAFQSLGRVAVGVGVGIGQHQATHLFETAFYEKTLNIRRQLVSAALDPKNVFSWLKTEKQNITVSNQRIHLITGEDDVVVGAGGVEAFVSVLEANGNSVTFDRPRKLPHHEPGAASPHLYSFLKNHFAWS